LCECVPKMYVGIGFPKAAVDVILHSTTNPGCVDIVPRGNNVYKFA